MHKCWWLIKELSTLPLGIIYIFHFNNLHTNSACNSSFPSNFCQWKLLTHHNPTAILSIFSDNSYSIYGICHFTLCVYWYLSHFLSLLQFQFQSVSYSFDERQTETRVWLCSKSICYWFWKAPHHFVKLISLITVLLTRSKSLYWNQSNSNSFNVQLSILTPNDDRQHRILLVHAKDYQQHTHTHQKKEKKRKEKILWFSAFVKHCWQTDRMNERTRQKRNRFRCSCLFNRCLFNWNK